MSELSQEELTLIFTSIGLVFLGFLIYGLWQTRLIGPYEPQPEIVEEDPLPDELEPEPEDEPEPETFDNELHGYRIINIAENIERIQEAQLFGLRERTEFAINYEGIIHAVFENPDELSLSDWIEKKIEEKGPRDETPDMQRAFLNIVLERRRETPLGDGIEVVRMNGYSSGELFIPWDNYILSFYYETENSREISSLERRRDHLVENIITK